MEDQCYPEYAADRIVGEYRMSNDEVRVTRNSAFGVAGLFSPLLVLSVGMWVASPTTMRTRITGLL